MIDQKFLDTFHIKPEDIQKIQDEIMSSIKNRDFAQLNNKYDPDAILHLSHDLVAQDKLSYTAKFTMSGMEFLIAFSDNPEKQAHL